MEYKVINENPKGSTILEKVLYNRGIENSDEYMNLTEKCVQSYEDLENIKEAVTLFNDNLNAKKIIGIIPDPDVDGQCSAAMIYRYVKGIYPDYDIRICYHTTPKCHDLSDIIVTDDIQFMIITDAGTNDAERCKELHDRGVEVLVLDHHEKEVDNPYALIVNNQTSPKYKNKQLCGAGIVYRFLQAVDEENFTEYADEYLDLVAFANISDDMDLRSYETRYFVDEGLKNIKNEFMLALAAAQDFSMGGVINVHNVQWYMTPVVNACMRMGTMEEKELLFRAFIGDFEEFDYKKRGGEYVTENIYDRAARLSKNVKARQDKKRDKAAQEIDEVVSELPDNKVLLINVDNILDDRGLTGVVAIRVSEKYRKPVILIKSFKDENGCTMYGGSARNFDHSPVASIKDITNETGAFELAQGHANAHGVVIKPENVGIAIEQFNKILKDVTYDTSYMVDFILDSTNLPEITDYCRIAESMKSLICKGIEDMSLAIEHITVSKNDIQVMGKSEDSIKFQIADVNYVQFKLKDGDVLYDWLNQDDEHNAVDITVVGKPSMNEYAGTKTPQFIIDDVIINERFNSEEEEYDSDDEWDEEDEW